MRDPFPFMPDEQLALQGACANPGDAEARRRYADYLQRNGAVAQAQAVRRTAAQIEARHAAERTATA